MKIQQLDDVEGRRSFVMVCDRGDDPVEALMIVESPAPLRRRIDPATGLALLDIDWAGS